MTPKTCTNRAEPRPKDICVVIDTRERDRHGVGNLKSGIRRPQPVNGDDRWWLSFIAPTESEFRAMLAQDEAGGKEPAR